jgi:hypothetical protein
MNRSDGSPAFTQGHPAPDDFYRALGYALVAFTEIDGALFGLYYALTVGEHADIERAKRNYYESWNFSARLRVVERAVGAHVTEPAARGQWRAIQSAVESLKEQRNELGNSSAGPSFERVAPDGLALVPTLGLPGAGAARGRARIDTQALIALAIEFEDMADAIVRFLERVAPVALGGARLEQPAAAAARRPRRRPPSQGH